jgi:hypothetical protein
MDDEIVNVIRRVLSHRTSLVSIELASGGKLDEQRVFVVGATAAGRAGLAKRGDNRLEPRDEGRGFPRGDRDGVLDTVHGLVDAADDIGEQLVDPVAREAARAASRPMLSRWTNTGLSSRSTRSVSLVRRRASRPAAMSTPT